MGPTVRVTSDELRPRSDAPALRVAHEEAMSHPAEETRRTDAATEAVAPAEPAGETSLLRVIWYPILLFVLGPAVVMLAVKLVFGI